MPWSKACRQALSAALLLAACAFGCGKPSPEPAAPAAGKKGPAPEWVTFYNPRQAWNGYTLTLHQARIPVLFDMNGRVVHSWPEARVKSRVRLLPDGSILAIGLGRQVVEYDWEGNKTWEFRTPGAIPHHDIIRLANGNTLVMLLREGESTDTLVEVNRAGQVVWTWRSIEHLGGLIPPDPPHPDDVTHSNSIQEIPDNPWYRAGDNRFRPGNILLSARNLSTILIVDRQTGQMVWSYRDLDHQHEALMNGPDLPEPGKIQVFNNRLRSFLIDRQTEILEIDPRDGTVGWRYKSPGFYSPTSGSQQALPNGNVLVTSTRGYRIFEITRQGELVWEWQSPYQPVRAMRVAPDACPQLARLKPEPRKSVARRPEDRHVDPDTYRFARQGSRMRAVINGQKRAVLKQEKDCRELLLPAAPRISVGYGIDRDRLRAAGRESRPPEFTILLSPAGEAAKGEGVELLRETVGVDGEPWRQKTLQLDPYALQAVRICLEIHGGAPEGAKREERFAYWEQPWVTTGRGIAPTSDAGEGDGDDLTPEEREVQRKHLKSLGYVG